MRAISGSLSSALLGLALAAPALASDGQLEIHQSCAAGNGCFPGDSAGFPVTITASGSYRLTSNLVVPDENTDGVVVSASFVTVDLNDFVISGPVSCTAPSVVCTPSAGTGSGIRNAAVTNVGIAVHNGGIVGMGLNGINLGDQSIVSDIRARSNRNRGIDVGAASIVRDNLATFNGAIGIFADDGSIVADNAVKYNGSAGIYTGDGLTIVHNAVYRNDTDGIFTSTGSTVADNVSGANVSDGIVTTLNCSVQRNSMIDNEDHGLRNIVGIAGGASAYRDNSIRSNILGTVTGALADMGGNDCDGTVSCP